MTNQVLRFSDLLFRYYGGEFVELQFIKPWDTVVYNKHVLYERTST